MQGRIYTHIPELALDHRRLRENTHIHPPPPVKRPYIYIYMSANLGGGSLMVLMDFCQCWPFSRCYVSSRGGGVYYTFLKWP